MLEEFGTKQKQQPIHITVKSSNPLGRKALDKEVSTAEESWTLSDKDTYVVNGSTRKQLPSGAYTIGFNHSTERSFFKKINIKIDELIQPNGGIVKEIIEEIDNFWSKEELYRKLGFLHYRGYLLYGPQGSGKTCIVQLVIKNIVDRGGLVFMCQDTYEFADGIKSFRSVEPDRQIVCLFEDIDALAKEEGESSILSFLDGEFKIEKVLNIATTNYPELLDKRLVNRPRRFDRVVKIDYPDESTRRAYFEKKLDKKELDKWVRDTEGLSFAGLAELVIRVKCLDRKFEDALEQLLEAQKTTISSNTSDGSTSPGFKSAD